MNIAARSILAIGFTFTLWLLAYTAGTIIADRL